MTVRNTTNVQWVRKYLPVLLSIVLMGVYFFLLERATGKHTGGKFIYPMDDPYIHMQVAKNLAFHGSWGINPGEFGSASSSLLYPVLLALLFKVFGVHAIIPFVINCVAGVILLCVVNRWLIKEQVSLIARIVILLILVFLVPLPILILIGMEHTLQCLFCFLFITRLALYLEVLKLAGPGDKIPFPWQIILYAVLVTTIRYEGLFLVAIGCLFLLYFRKLKDSFLLGFFAALPLVAFGIYSISKGSYFLPNSVLIKSDPVPASLSGIVPFIRNMVMYKLLIYPPQLASQDGDRISLTAGLRLLIIIPVLYLLLLKNTKQKSSYAFFLLMLAFCTLLHLSFAATGWYFRYEAYLILCAAVIVMVVLYQHGKDFLTNQTSTSLIMVSLLAVFMFFPFLLRSVSAFSLAKRSCINIYEQQYQSAQFVRKYYTNEVIAANDIGLVSFRNNIKMIDLFGLANIDVAKSKKGMYETPSFLDSLVRMNKTKLAIVYDEWFDKSLLNRWVKVGSWEISNNVMCASSVVSFYVMDERDKPETYNNLKDFQRILPDNVKVVYY